jgi:hypothetical protein
MFLQMGRMLMTEHMEALLEGRVVISSLAWTVARMKRIGLTLTVWFPHLDYASSAGPVHLLMLTKLLTVMLFSYYTA